MSSSLKCLRLHSHMFLVWQQRWWHTYKKLLAAHPGMLSYWKHTALTHAAFISQYAHKKKWIFCCITQKCFKYIKVNLWPTWLNLLSLKMLFHYLQHWRMTVAFHLLKAGRQSFQNCHDVALCLFAQVKWMNNEHTNQMTNHKSSFLHYGHSFMQQQQC